MAANNIFTLKEFIDYFGDTDLIKSIYIDDSDNTIQSTLIGLMKPLDRLHNENNILDDDEYLTLENGEYVFNRGQIFEKYGEYIISLYFPIIPPENLEIAQNMAENMNDIDYIKNIGKYSTGCELLIRPKFEPINDPEFFPEVYSSNTVFLNKPCLVINITYFAVDFL